MYERRLINRDARDGAQRCNIDTADSPSLGADASAVRLLGHYLGVLALQLHACNRACHSRSSCPMRYTAHRDRQSSTKRPLTLQTAMPLCCVIVCNCQMRSMVRVPLSPSVLVTGVCSWTTFRPDPEMGGRELGDC